MSDYASIPNERSVEIPWAIEKCQRFPVLDVGCRESIYLGDLGGEVQGIDVREMKRDGLNAFWRGDIRAWTHYRTFPTILALSTIEHIGLGVKSYETTDDAVEDGDLQAVRGCLRNLDPGGDLLITVPYGPNPDTDWYRVYNSERLEWLLQDCEWTAEMILNPAWDVGGVALITATHKG